MMIMQQLLTSHDEKLIYSRDNNRDNDANEPHPECVHGHIRVIGVRHRGSYFGVRRFTVNGGYE